MRKTKQKDLIMEALHALDGQHPTSDDVYEYVHGIDPKLSLGTVYRNLNLFAEKGIIQRIELPTQPARYQLGDKRHLYAYCEECHILHDLHDQHAKKLEKIISEQLSNIDGLVIDDWELLIHGCMENECPEKHAASS